MSKQRVSRLPAAGSSFLALVIAVFLVGCSASGDTEREAASRADGYVSFDAMVAEYEAFQEELPLPDGVEYYEQIRPAEPEEYGIGVGEGAAYSEYMCQWSRAYLEAGEVSDQAGTDAAMKALKAEMDNPATRFYPEGGYRDFIAEAELGDPTQLKSLVSANCPAGGVEEIKKNQREYAEKVRNGDIKLETDG